MWQLYTFILEVINGPKGVRPAFAVTLQGGDTEALQVAAKIVKLNGALQATVVHVSYDSARHVGVVHNPELS